MDLWKSWQIVMNFVQCRLSVCKVGAWWLQKREWFVQRAVKVGLSSVLFVSVSAAGSLPKHVKEL